MPTTYTIKEAIVLAGGLGTRLRSAVPDLPKCMAPVAGHPFLFHVIKWLRSQGINRIIFSLGYKHEIIEDYLQKHFSSLDYTCVVEPEPLGTGGGIQLALCAAKTPHVTVVNGDTLYAIDLSILEKQHLQANSICSLSLKPLQNFDRYGVVETDSSSNILRFLEKQWTEKGNINGGIYIIHKDRFLSIGFPEKFSFETDFLQQPQFQTQLKGFVQDAYFIDIGIPEDFEKANTELQNPDLSLQKIDKSLSLFLDRDGVINEDKPGSYIFTPEEFVFMAGAPELFKDLANRFAHIFITTNQRGIGRGLMTETALTAIHQEMLHAIENVGGRIDGIYYAAALSPTDPYRKPNPGMAFQAKQDFEDVDLNKSIMVGNNISDMQFGRNAGMHTVFLSTTNKEIQLPHPDIDLIFPDLQSFAKALGF